MANGEYALNGERRLQEYDKQAQKYFDLAKISEQQITTLLRYLILVSSLLNSLHCSALLEYSFLSQLLRRSGMQNLLRRQLPGA